jgi:diguanylate cyclase (GGDEF)-like protein
MGDHVNPSPGRRRTDSAEHNRLDLPLALVVDDEEHYRAYVAVLARRSGFEVDQAADGEAALSLCARTAYDLILVDQEMPRMTGLELIERVRAQSELSTVYALMLTAHDDMETKLRALSAGYDDFLAKTSSDLEILARIVAAHRIITRQRALDSAVREMYGLATRDELTGVFNRRFLISDTERMLQEGRAISAVLFDLDGFKQVNDRLGHVAGDDVLRDVGALFCRSTRPEDLIARYGGDEFVMIVALLELEHVERIAERLSREIGELRWRFGEDAFGIGVSTGIATSRLLPNATVAKLLNTADRDLYKNKWLKKHPLDGPESYEYPASSANADLVVPVHPVAERATPAPLEHPVPRPPDREARTRV